MDNSKLRNGTIFIMAAVLVAGTISLMVPSSFAQTYEDPYAKDPYADPYAKDHKKASVNIQKIQCVNENTNLNGIEINEVPLGAGTTEAQQLPEDGNANGNGLLDGNGINLDKNLVSICVNVNLNGQADLGILE